MKIENLFDSNGNLNIGYLSTIKEFVSLRDCEQNPQWHSEGNVLNHTLLSYYAFVNFVMKKYNLHKRFSTQLLNLLKTSILLHDIGKSVTTFKGRDGKWHAYNHEIEGEKIARYILWDENIYDREFICSLIRYHMDALKMFDDNKWMIKMLKISCRVPIEFLYYVKLSDLLGSRQTNNSIDNDIEKLQFLKKMAMNLDIWYWGGKKIHAEDIIKYSKRCDLPWINKKNKECFLIFGISGAGKNTYINNELVPKYNNIVQISRDDIRVKLGFCDETQKMVGNEEQELKVTEAYDKMIECAITNNATIVLNNLNIKHKYRIKDIDKIKKHGYSINYVYVEAPTFIDNCERRKNQVSVEVLDNMRRKIEWPEPDEYDNLIIYKQEK